MPPKDSRRIRSGEELLIAVIGDEDTVTGFLLAGAGNLDARRVSNFLVVSSKTTHSQIEEAFKSFTSRDDISIVIIAQSVANDIRHLMDSYDRLIPAVVEIPSKDKPYDPSQDTVLQRVRLLLGERD
nr:vacuolar H(+)-ATPase subunit F [Andalucia godoyi]|eukprot:ANDGO_01144.mRNA.1 V-type proton ATPase subunit F